MRFENMDLSGIDETEPKARRLWQPACPESNEGLRAMPGQGLPVCYRGKSSAFGAGKGKGSFPGPGPLHETRQSVRMEHPQRFMKHCCSIAAVRCASGKYL